MTDGLLFTLFTFPLHNLTSGNRSRPHMRPVQSTTAPLQSVAPISLPQNIQIMQTNNRKGRFTFFNKPIPMKGSDILLQIVFQYEESENPEIKHYHSFTITEVMWTKDSKDNSRYENLDYVTIGKPKKDKYYRGDKKSITLELTAPYSSHTPVKSFLDYKHKIDHHTGFATDYDLINMAYDNDGDNNYYHINVCDNYRLVQELFSRLNGRFCYENQSLLQSEVYLYTHKYDRNFTGTAIEQMQRTVRKYRISRVRAKLLDWGSSFVKQDAKEGDFHNFMVGPRTVKFYFYIDMTLPPEEFTIQDRSTRFPLSLGDAVDRGEHRSLMRENNNAEENEANNSISGEVDNSPDLEKTNILAEEELYSDELNDGENDWLDNELPHSDELNDGEENDWLDNELPQ